MKITNTTHRTTIILLLSSMLVIPACRHRVVKHWIHVHEKQNGQPTVTSGTKRVKKPRTQQPKPFTPHITVWVHGTVFPWQAKPLPQGLHHVDKLHEKNRYRVHAKIMSERYPHSYQYEHFYTFGWTGHLSFPGRERAARELQRQLTELLATFEADKKPKIRLICHSHGGNVALNLANVANPLNKHDPRLQVSELILLACPVQCATSHCAKDPMFKNIYALYSRSDVGQIADPQGLYASMRRSIPHPVSGKKRHKPKCPLFSARQFVPQDNLLQGCLFMNGASTGHAEFSHGEVLKLVPELVDSLHECRDIADARPLPREEAVYSLHVKLRKEVV